jgi:DNA-binding MarR family transcriptional regulator
MAAKRPGRAALLAALNAAMRKASAQGVLYSATVAARLGLASSDLECLDIILLAGPVTAGRLAAATGLTTGAITGVVDRLEKAGFVRRERDDSDRRKVFIAPVPERMMEIGRFYQLMQRAMEKQAASYTDAELRLLLRYATESYHSILIATTELKEMMEASPKAKTGSVKKPARPR